MVSLKTRLANNVISLKTRLFNVKKKLSEENPDKDNFKQINPDKMDNFKLISKDKEQEYEKSEKNKQREERKISRNICPMSKEECVEHHCKWWIPIRDKCSIAIMIEKSS